MSEEHKQLIEIIKKLDTENLVSDTYAKLWDKDVDKGDLADFTISLAHLLASYRSAKVKADGYDQVKSTREKYQTELKELEALYNEIKLTKMIDFPAASDELTAQLDAKSQ
ncbi:hypothetical protein A3K34_00075 [candidate division WWE3 bacterium RIFOXYC1_FULL_40_10]|uniref:Uncharacterized protein n=1 Tax=candidate division WWE3 bacterium RIFOXYA2_FULL_46_9 TaxID=1802636 RepID=A0A1F4W199_UNCKA|nr:MAG: hypothetical protein A3K58_00075 [candidate division WWE3 bacterium RIFOXYB1_FULL_40_22]OGC61292.1 MAG: hypothetical protein A3K37_00075 [candidate division WWE3 bacterium RIFOXYA1_FULL_40_11]OGC63202.1 MAG: hypothetical protein A2264_00730 [candidate division WWE3 bacterium RIFOXYA2_FULL_46_9]OGC65283.1 MAG: hypothetical protein A2326_04360 [candidate division WWE3 bacterium RIFOXYB2_FULL_41_6]OGC65675.1 MAG: hypothetical protein A3K34_00075 [candidate division WWE3 bacterium RIFOXYC1_